MDSDWSLKAIFFLFDVGPYVVAAAIPVIVIYVAIRLAKPRRK